MPPKLLEHQLVDRLGQITARITPNEGYLLYTLARDVPEHGLIVEVGSAYGYSAGCLGLGKPKSAVLELVDNFTYTNFGKTSASLLRANLKNAGIINFVIRETNSEHYRPPRVPDLVHIDGCHDYEAVIHDLRFIANGAPVIVCHDYNDGPHPGVTKAVDEFVGETTYRIDRKVQRMVVLKV